MIPTASLIGYTNAGKSTVLNALSGADALVEDKLFATLDPTIRRVALPGGLWILLADTVGFIRNLPHQLVAAFRATFEEVTYSDLLVHVVDASHPQMDEQMAAVERVLAEIGVPEKPIVTAFNKADAVEDVETLQMKARRCAPSVILSALRGTGLDELREALAAQARRRLHRVEVLLPLERGDLVSLAHERGRVEIEHYAAEGIELVAHVPGDLAARLAALDLRAPAPVEEW
jgi:GTP-binding protein HflX